MFGIRGKVSCWFLSGKDFSVFVSLQEGIWTMREVKIKKRREEMMDRKGVYEVGMWEREKKERDIEKEKGKGQVN